MGAFSALGAAARGQLHGQQGAFVHRDVRESSDAHRYPTPCAVITSHHLGTHADQMFVSETQGERRFNHQSKTLQSKDNFLKTKTHKKLKEKMQVNFPPKIVFSI